MTAMTAEAFLSLYVVVLVATALICGAVAVIVWRRQHAPGTSGLIAMMLTQIVWSVSYALQLSPIDRPDPMFYTRIAFLGVVAGTAAFLVFVFQFTDRGHWVTKRTLALLAIEPVLFMAAIYTNDYHHLVVSDYKTGSVFTPAIAFWLHTLYSYSVLITGGVLLTLRVLRTTSIYRKQASLLLIGLGIVVTANALSIAHVNPGPIVDFTPVGFTIAGILNALALFRYRMLDLVPIARDTVMERMKDGVLVLDAENRIVDLNPAAQTLLGMDVTAVLGQQASRLLAPHDDTATRWKDFPADFHDEVVLERNGRRYVDLQITALPERRNARGGRVVVIRDVSGVKRIESELREANDRLRQKLAEIELLQTKLKEQAIRDPLTGLYNRRFLQETLMRELAQATRAQSPLSVAMIDLDHFKRINDAHGHYTGDRLLEALSDLLRSYTRGGDVACRYGGEEFLVVMPGASLEVAATRADEWRRAFAAIKTSTGTTSFSATFSAGVGSFPLHGLIADRLLNAADQALYAAKAAGRNRVMIAERPPAPVLARAPN
jgi:diguanylate cyclase (GGDEF)-like protein/PAS domain S-box-containing protein